jgi:hypothetical protein
MNGPEFTVVVGVDHRIQYLNDDCGPEWTREIRRFQRYLAEEASAHRVDLLAEEFNAEGVVMNRAALSTIQELARMLALSHLFCDPDTSERQALSISDPKQREDVWIDRLRASGAHRVLFVCGDDHADSFVGKLGACGVKSQVASRNWGHNWQFMR